MNDGMLRQLPLLMDDLSASGWAQMPNAIGRRDCSALAHDLELHYEAGDFRAAQIGRGTTQSEHKTIRNDQIHWLKAGAPEQSIQYWLKEMNDLTLALNENFFLSINSFDSHFACYEPGSFYHKHRDQFRGSAGRVLSVVLFLNPDWLKASDGELLIYQREDDCTLAAEIKPEIGTLVVFQSATILHEVRTTKRRRLSLTGWMSRGDDEPNRGISKSPFE